MRQIFICVVIILAVVDLHAQPFIDIAGLQFQHSPDASLTGKDKNPVAMNTLQGNMNLPIKVFKKDILLVNPAFERIKLDFKKPGSKDLDLYGATMALSYIKKWKNEKWKTVFVSVNRISSDFKNVTLKHYQPGGAVLMIYERNEKITYKIGAYYNAEFFGAFVLPLLSVDWKINNRLILYGIVPRNLVLEYKINKHVYAGTDWKAITSSYRYQSVNGNDYFKLEENQIRLFADFYLTRHFVLNVEAGHTFLREYYNRGELQRLAGIDSGLALNEGFLLKGGLSYRIRLDEKK